MELPVWRDGLGQAKVTPNSLFLLTGFFLDLSSSDYCMPLVSFQISEMLILTIFVRAVIAFMQKGNIGDPYSAILALSPL